MDDVLNFVDTNVCERYKIYPDWLPANNPFRQFITLWLISWFGAIVLYLLFATPSYYLLFDHGLKQHKLFLKNQIRREIFYTMKSIPIMGLMSSVSFLLQVRGHSRLLNSLDESRFGWWHIPITICCFILFTDSTIYWIHRVLHWPVLYRMFHKAHHTWKVPTPFASHAFHPVDGFVQSSPYHLYVFLFPMYKWLFLGMFMFVNLWTIAIHDNEVFVLGMKSRALRWLINGAAHHTDHHLYYNYNYGQFFTFWDRWCGSFRTPSSFVHAGPKEQLRSRAVMGEALREHCAEMPAVLMADSVRSQAAVITPAKLVDADNVHDSEVDKSPTTAGPNNEDSRGYDTVGFIESNASSLKLE